MNGQLREELGGVLEKNKNIMEEVRNILPCFKSNRYLKMVNCINRLTLVKIFECGLLVTILVYSLDRSS